ncbi:hypothetical protein HID58_088811 [Brassica napus]|uniref:Uncharacterized protein n=1 Tax=Brassica napus TaxID=3708 RepID=A0ABQ7WYP2_BRANA|nr:hypothetical protein HID58_091776 [Brassica napus]KAH0860550.1 hypothetical protein HID58_088811 [Brassica napus]
MATKPNGKSPVSSASDEEVMFFRDISLGTHETQLRFRLIHFWEAWNPDAYWPGDAPHRRKGSIEGVKRRGEMPLHSYVDGMSD